MNSKWIKDRDFKTTKGKDKENISSHRWGQGMSEKSSNIKTLRGYMKSYSGCPGRWQLTRRHTIEWKKIFPNCVSDRIHIQNILTTLKIKCQHHYQYLIHKCTINIYKIFIILSHCGNANQNCIENLSSLGRLPSGKQAAASVSQDVEKKWRCWWE